MGHPWRTIALAVALTVVAVVVFNAQSFWLNLRYKLEPNSFAVASTLPVVPTPPVVTTPLPLPSPKLFGITNANLAKIPLGGSGANYTSASARAHINFAFAKQQRGKLFVQVESHGELWYVNPDDARRYRVPSLAAAASFIASLKPPTLTVAAEPTAAASTLTIESLGLSVPVVYVTDATEEAFQAGLKNGVVHYPGTANPGQFGNVYIFGHSSDYWWSDGHFKTVFAILPQIKLGADIVLTSAQGQAFTYRVFDAKVVAATDTAYLDQRGYQRKLLTLQTSWPIGTALKRYVVLAELVPN